MFAGFVKRQNTKTQHLKLDEFNLLQNQPGAGCEGAVTAG